MGLFQRKSSKDEDASVLKEQEKEKVKWSRRPANTAFKQQRLKAWQPILTPATVLPTFFLIGLVFIPLGAMLLYGSNLVKEFTIDYTRCEFDAPTTSFAQLPSSAFSYHTKASIAIPAPSWSYTASPKNATNIGLDRVCRLRFTVPDSMSKPVFMYYKLTNYYQNHRRYVKSITQAQLQGTASTYADLENGACKPVAVNSNNSLPIYPCGLIANSVFNDTYSSPVLLNPTNGATSQTYNVTSIGISWPGEAQKYGISAYNASTCTPPPYWAERYPNGYVAGASSVGGGGQGGRGVPNLALDEHFMVWMRTAGLPTFRKLWWRNDNEDLLVGEYEMEIFLNYPVAPFSGTKSLVFSTVSFIGGRNPFLGIAYLVVGGACVILGLALTARHLIRPRKLGDMRFLSWNTPGKETK